ncbi:MAG TPA: peroxiredoxin-like family protein [Thermomicrobiales bacterium]|nr:peroxiredoxin-like family protein [Thermomicrobiales bacterium]
MSSPLPEHIPSVAPDTEVFDTDGNPVRLSQYWQDGPTALVFMRHVGCIFCREQVQELRDNAAALAEAGLSVVVITPDRPSRARKFIEEYKVPFPTLTDPERNAYRAYGLMDGSIGQLINKRIVAGGLRATLNGTFPRGTTSSPRQLPGTAIVDSTGRLRHLHHGRDAADHLTSRQLIDLARDVETAPAASSAA